MEGDSLKLNFEIALEKINTLSKHNQELMNQIEELTYQLSQSKNELKPSHPIDRFNNISKDAEAAIKRYQQFLKKEFPNAKSKQSQGQPV
tara:strand:- start:1 stop:270 length:270 start_codon:yes stop_codon:yes gene_type:complete